MSRYERLPAENPQDEMDAAFESDDDDDQPTSHLHRNNDRAQRTPLLASSSSSHPLDRPDTPSIDPPVGHYHSYHRQPAPPGAYNFEYDFPPPPGSPPPQPTAYGNTNGVVPTFDEAPSAPRPNIFKRAFGAILPTHYARDARGGGTENDGVFANLSAKPTRAIPAADGQNGVYMSPEEAQKEAPPSYASAQADAVPPYWETTILAPNMPNAAGELIIDGLPIGSFFSFLWNLLVSMSFQFVGFLLTYLLHTTHSAKFGSRAGLGITLVQYGFYLRSQATADTDDSLWSWPADDKLPEAKPSFATAEEADKYYASLGDAASAVANATTNLTDADLNNILNSRVSVANEWLSFFLMTMGWFILLTSLLGYWRVKKWERDIRRAAEEAANPRPPPQLTPEDIEREREVIEGLERAFGLVSSSATTIRNGLGLAGTRWAEARGGNTRDDLYERLNSRA